MEVEMSSITKRSIDDTTAQSAIEAARRKAEEIGIKICVSIADESAQLKAFLRMDGAPAISIPIAQDKAHTAASLGVPTDTLFEWMKDDPPLLHGITQYPRFIVFGGGYPIREDGHVIGAIGVSGGHYKQDMQCAEAALAAIKVAG
jgi:uncharacterized protein GlcG (DUF336 family)